MCYESAAVFDHIRGQQTAVETLTRALRSGLVHHAYRFEGIDGVGKELTAIAFAQALLCDSTPLGCGTCESCRRVVQRSEQPPQVPLHPDVVLVARGLYPPEMLGGRKESVEISVEQVRRVVLARAAYAPHEGAARVFIVRDADQLSISAANALLKTLEEPRPATHFVLLTARADRLLDTIRSRCLPVRFGPLSDEVIADLLREHGVANERVAELVEMAAGSVATALLMSDAELSGAREEFVGDLMRAVEAADLADGVRFSEGVARDRGRLIDDLRALASAYARRARQQAADAPRGCEIAARRHGLVLDAIDAVERNGSAGLCIASLVASLRHVWLWRPGTKPPIVVQRR